MTDKVILPRIAEGLSQMVGHIMVLIKGPQREQTGIAGDLTTEKSARIGC